MTAPTVGPCSSWITEDDVTSCCAGLADPPKPEQFATAITFATNILYRLSGRQFPGECERTLRPCSGNSCGCGVTGLDSGWSWFWWDPNVSAWSAWLPFAYDRFPLCGGCNGGVCDPPSVTLPAPVVDVTEVVINGEVLDPSAYAVVNYRELVRLDGNDWPTENDLSASSAVGGAANTWQVSYTYGRGPGDDGKAACALLACQIAQYLCNGDGSCLLNDRVRQIVREGVTFSLEDLERLLDRGRTGVRLVDMWIESVNPNQNQRRARVSRLGAPRRNFRTFT